MPSLPVSIPSVVEVEWIGGAGADPSDVPCLLVEVPHGADRRVHYEALRARLVGALPEDLHAFFHVNTDVGAVQLGRRVAEHVVAAAPGRGALVLRCLIPRTFIDCNRIVGIEPGGDLQRGGMTSAIPPYVRDPEDQRLLIGLHRAYVDAAEQAYQAICGAGGFALSPHTYGPRTLAVERVDDHIVDALYRAHEPERYAASPLRPQVDLITTTAEGQRHDPEGVADAVIAGLGVQGLAVEDSTTYHLHPATQGFRFAARFPGQVFSLEVRRDLLVEAWTPFEEQRVDAAAIEPIAGVLAEAIDGWLTRRDRG